MGHVSAHEGWKTAHIVTDDASGARVNRRAFARRPPRVIPPASRTQF